MAEDKDEAEPPARRTKFAEAADAGVRLAKLKPEQTMTLILIGVLAFACGTQAYQMKSEREDRREIARERQDAASSMIRESNAQAELMRQHCAMESNNLRTFFAAENEKRMRFESEQREKDRAALATLVAKLTDLERAIGKRAGECAREPR